MAKTKIPYVIGLPDPFHFSRGEAWVVPYSNAADFTYKTEEGRNGTLHVAVFYAKEKDISKPLMLSEGLTRVFYKEKPFGVGAQGNVRINALFSSTDYKLAYYVATPEGESQVITKPFKTRPPSSEPPPPPPPDEPYDPDDPPPPPEPVEVQYFDSYFDAYFK